MLIMLWHKSHFRALSKHRIDKIASMVKFPNKLEN